jgi:hypothetical protein
MKLITHHDQTTLSGFYLEAMNVEPREIDIPIIEIGYCHFDLIFFDLICNPNPHTILNFP